jgi:glutathione S-transferase
MIELWELKGRDDRRYSLYSWRARMALRHKGLAFESHPVRLSDKAAIEFSGGKTVPVIRDGDTVVRDSWSIAEHLEARYPERPTLFGGPIGQGLARAWNAWVDRVVVAAMMPVIIADLHERVDPDDDAFVRKQFEGYLKMTLEESRAGREPALQRLQRALEPVRATLKRQPFVCGAAPAYADYILFSPFQWARVMCPQDPLAADDPLAAWRARLLELHGGFAREVKAA